MIDQKDEAGVLQRLCFGEEKTLSLLTCWSKEYHLTGRQLQMLFVEAREQKFFGLMELFFENGVYPEHVQDFIETVDFLKENNRENLRWKCFLWDLKTDKRLLIKKRLSSLTIAEIKELIEIAKKGKQTEMIEILKSDWRYQIKDSSAF